MILDNTIPGTRAERGLHVWQPLPQDGSAAWWEDDYMNAVRMPSLDNACSSRLLLASFVPYGHVTCSTSIAAQVYGWPWNGTRHIMRWQHRALEVLGGSWNRLCSRKNNTAQPL